MERMNDFVFCLFPGVPGWGGHVQTVLTVQGFYEAFYRALIVFVFLGVVFWRRYNQ